MLDLSRLLGRFLSYEIKGEFLPGKNSPPTMGFLCIFSFIVVDKRTGGDSFFVAYSKR